MNKKTTIWIVSGMTGVLVLAVIYSFYFRSPSPFPTNEHLIEELQDTFPAFPEVGDSEILEVFDVGERKKYVPLVTSEGSYGSSYWVWDKYKWKVESVDTKGGPRIWKANKGDPSTYHIVWNIHPNDRVKYIDFHVLRDRGYSIANGTDETYYPRIQMKQTVSLEEKSYGVLQLPKEWASFVSGLNDTYAAQQPDLFFNQLYTEQQVSFGWIPYDTNNEEIFPNHSVNGSGFSNGGGDAFAYLSILNEYDLEVWSGE
ncbi:hypothetical protein [Paraliobacillus sediminis]|uniref:hypothetical protein n=1 Tax=Paraliobacillus sediminis TaxID=1885916 RepID=UPI000E3EB383|nr:hypothetical protein [Paraliobacillus sediminis]